MKLGREKQFRFLIRYLITGLALWENLPTKLIDLRDALIPL